MHGFAFNACTDLSGFELIVPCGIREYTVTSIEKLRGQSPKPKTLARDAATILCERLEATLEGFEDVEKAPSLEKAIGIEEDSRGDEPIPNL
jgi:lipoyl(octanoyl) transferase